jgi:hypothetical protein
MGKGLFQSKTVWVNLLTTAIGIGTYMAGSEVIADNASLVALIVTGVGVANVILRIITGKPITSVKG